VAALRNIVHPAAVARVVMKKTKHVLLVGENALTFAKEQGFPETDLLTPETRKAWIAWKETRLRGDSRIPVALAQLEPAVRELVEKPVHGTIHCSALDTHGTRLRDDHLRGRLQGPRPRRRLADPRCGTLPGQHRRLMRIGRARRGQSAQLRQLPRRREPPARNEAQGRLGGDLQAGRRDDHARSPVPRRPGRPNFNVVFYCLTKDGRFAAAHIHGPASLAVHDGEKARMVDSASLLD